MQQQFELSGEGPAPQVLVANGLPQKTALEIARVNVAKREYQKLYMDYWNSTTQMTGTGRPVDAVICPAAPHAAVIPTKYEHVGYTAVLNLLDYTSVVIPVTSVDKRVDTAASRHFLSELDEKLYKGCEYIHPPCKYILTAQTTRRRMTERRRGSRCLGDDCRRRRCLFWQSM